MGVKECDDLTFYILRAKKTRSYQSRSFTRS